MDNSKNGSSPPPNDESSKGNERDAVLQFISERLMEEEELGNMLHDGLALQTTEKSLHDALHNINLDTSCSINTSGTSSDISSFLDFQLNYCRTDSSKEVTVPKNGSSPPPNDESSKTDKQVVLLEFISEMLMEEEEEDELSNNPYMLHDGLALQATEKSLYDALHNINLDSESLISPEFHGHNSESRNEMTGDYLKMVSDTSGVKKNYRSREDGNLSKHDRSNKQSANNTDDESEPLEMYDDVLLCSNSDRAAQACDEKAHGKAKKQSHRNQQSKEGPNRGGGGGKKIIIKKELIDLRSLLMQCAQAVENFDNKTLSDLLCQIRQHSSPKGNGMERAAHYFANALESRLACTGTDSYAALISKRISIAEVLKGYKMFIIACPFRHMSNILANNIIGNLASRATTLNIIDFGIMYGFQWPCLIYALSKRLGGPPKLHITGIDFPQPGFRPSERVVDTCRRLAKCAERFGVPFEYKAIAQKWDTITQEDLKIEKNELLVVNCMYRLHNVPDEMETNTDDTPRDAVLNLIKNINPDLFVHGVANGTYDTPFFVTRFREAFFHFSSMFDMLDATIPHDDENRLVFEKQCFGKDAMNIIACEGTERVERPETYKRWQARTVRVGFKQVPIDQEIMKKLSKVKMDYHKNFFVEEDGKWILLGWKGHVIQGFSCWRPAYK